MGVGRAVVLSVQTASGVNSFYSLGLMHCVCVVVVRIYQPDCAYHSAAHAHRLCSPCTAPCHVSAPRERRSVSSCTNAAFDAEHTLHMKAVPAW